MKKNNVTPEKPSFESAMRLALRFEDAPTALSVLEEMEKFNMIDNGNQNFYLQILRCAAIAEQVRGFVSMEVIACLILNFLKFAGGYSQLLLGKRSPTLEAIA